MKRSVRLVGLVCVAVIVPIVPFVALGELPGEKWLSSADENAWQFGLIGVGLLTIDVLLPIPSSVLATMLGGRLGLPLGWFAATVGMSLGSLVGYVVGRLWPERLSVDLPNTPGLLVLFVSRPVPVLAEAMALAAGAARIPLAHALAACLAGNVVYGGAMAAVGAAYLAEGSIVVAVGIALLIPIGGWTLWRMVGNRSDDGRDAL